MIMTNTIARLLILILTDAGGEGKTTIALLIRALLELMGEPVGFLDADAGNYSGSIQLQNAGTGASLKTLNWQVSQGAASRILADHLDGHIIFDTGANTTASGQAITGLFPVLQAQAKAAGYRTIALMPVSTNKPGAVGALTALAANYPGWEHLFVRVNRDGSAAFEDGLDLTRTVDLRHLQTGYQAYVRKAGGLAEAVSSPLPNFGHAADHIADWMSAFASQPLVIDVFGRGPLTALEALGRTKPLRSVVTAVKLEDVTDRALGYFAGVTAQMRILNKGQWSVASHQEVIRKLEAGEL